VSRSYVYVFVSIATTASDHEFYVVPSRFVSENVQVRTRPNSIWYVIERAKILKYRDRWSHLGAKG